MKQGIIEAFGIEGVVFIVGLIVCVALLKLTPIVSVIACIIFTGLVWFFRARGK